MIDFIMSVLDWGLTFLLWALGFFTLSGVVVAVGMLFKKDLGVRTFSTGETVANYELPDWLYWWQNLEDNLTGDKRGDYWNAERFRPSIFTQAVWTSPTLKMWWWSAIRNPANNLKRIVIGVDVREFTFHKLCGDDSVRDDTNSEGFHILYARPKDGWFIRPLFYLVKGYGNGRGVVLQFGWKIKLKYNTVTYSQEIDNFKGVTVEMNPYKDLT